MADFPLAINLQGDYGYKVVIVDDSNTIEEVISRPLIKSLVCWWLLSLKEQYCALVCMVRINH